jgi:hypothetical protein
MLDTSAYADRREAIKRPCRMGDAYERIARNRSMRPAARALLLELLTLPPKWQISVTHIVKRLDYGGRDLVRALLSEIVAAGHGCMAPERYEDGTYKRGIYIVSASPVFGGAVDIGEGEKTSRTGQLGQGQMAQPGPENTSPVIYNSIDNPEDTTCAEPVEIAQSATLTKAETGQGRSKSHVTEKAEPRQGSAKSHHANERRSGAANGSPVKKRAEKSSEKQGHVRIAEQARARLIAAGGEALADPRCTSGLIDLRQVILWLSLGYDMDRDILSTIAAISGRASMRAGAVKTWKYYDAAICAAHAERMGRERPRAAPKRGPRLDPYAAPPPDPDDGGAWQQVKLALVVPQNGGRR